MSLASQRLPAAIDGLAKESHHLARRLNVLANDQRYFPNKEAAVGLVDELEWLAQRLHELAALAQSTGR